MQKEGEWQNKVLVEIVDNAKELPMESQNLLPILARGVVFMRSCMIRQSTADQPHIPPDEHST